MGRAQLNIGRASTVLPLALVSQSIHRLTRHDLESLTERLIEELDRRAGDPDEETGNDVEDDFLLSDAAIERAVSDPTVDCIDQDSGAYVEWHTKPGNLRRKGQAEILPAHEEDEDDDPAEEDDPSGCEHDGREVDDGI